MLIIRDLILVTSLSTGANVSNATTEAVYSFVCEYFENYKCSPTIREIAQGCYLAHTSVPPHLKKLVKEGRLSKEPYKQRSLSLPER